MCKAEGGLKVFIQPEKTDRVRYVWDTAGKMDAEGTFQTYFPQARVVEAMTEERGFDGRRLNRFDTYTAVPKTNPPISVNPNKESPYVLSIHPLEYRDPNVYEISKKTTEGKNHRREDMSLSRNGQLYARHSTFVHYWNGIRYPDAVPHWRCPDTWGMTPPKEASKASRDRWLEQSDPLGALRSLIVEFPKN